MDKLKQFKPYQFWALFVLALILPLVGWIVARGGLISEAEARTKLLDTAFSLPTGEAPNDRWVESVTQVNDQQKRLVQATWQGLWDSQKELMTWPEGISNPEQPTDNDLRRYKALYPAEVATVRNIINPLRVDPDSLTGDLLGVCALHMMPFEDWGNLPPTPQQMRDAQEDLWLTANLFYAIADVNKDAQLQHEAPIREIVEILLRGGSPVKPGEAPAGAPPGPGGPMDPMMGGGISRQGSQAQSAPLDADFDPSDEFGPEDVVGEGGGQAGAPPGPDAMLMPGGPGSQMSSTVKKRYVHENPQWKTRGFYLKLTMDHRKLPDLLVSLSGTAWPVRVTRVHQIDLATENLGQGSGSGGGRRGRPQSRTKQMPSGGFGARPNPFQQEAPAAMPESPDGSVSALADPMLAHVTISGLITIYNAPGAAEAAADGTTPAAGTAPADGQVPAVPAAEPPVSDPSAAPATTPDPVATSPATPAGVPADPASAPSPDAAPATPAPAGTPAPLESSPAPAEAKPAAETKPASPAPTGAPPAAGSTSPPGTS